MLPSRATCTRMTSPQRPPFMLLGKVGQPSINRYGLGSSDGFGYEASCARAVTPHAAMTPAINTSPTPSTRDIKPSRREQELHSATILYRFYRGRTGVFVALMAGGA